MNPQSSSFPAPVFISSCDIQRAVPFPDAVKLLESFLLAGFDPERDGLRSTLKTDRGLFLQMPSTSGNYTGTKLLTISPENASSNLPVIQGIYALFGGPDQRPLAVLDGTALTNLRTPAVSALGALRLTSPGPKNLLIFGTGPQAWEHIKAFSTVLTINRVGIVGRNPGAAKSLSARAAGLGLKSKVCSTEEVANADLIICCTGSAEPLFDGSHVKDTAVVIAIGSHEPARRELDDALMAHASICVESLRTSQLEAGDIIQAMESGAIVGPESLITLADVVSGHKRIPHGRPAVLKTTGMPWQDLAIATAAYEAIASEVGDSVLVS